MCERNLTPGASPPPADVEPPGDRATLDYLPSFRPSIHPLTTQCHHHPAPRSPSLRLLVNSPYFSKNCCSPKEMRCNGMPNQLHLESSLPGHFLCVHKLFLCNHENPVYVKAQFTNMTKSNVWKGFSLVIHITETNLWMSDADNCPNVVIQ